MKSTVHSLLLLLLVSLLLPVVPSVRAAATVAEVKNLSLNGGVDDGKARLVIEADLKGLPDKGKAIFSTVLNHSMKISHTPRLKRNALSSAVDLR